MFRLEGKTALVTGASGGIGSAIAIALATQGADIVVHYHANQESAQTVQEEVAALGRRALLVQANLTQASECDRLWQESEQAYGHLDILVNNAGMLKHGFLGFLSEASWDEMQQANLKPAFLLSKKAARSMARRKFGRIINISSQAGQTGEVMAAHYSAAKAGLLGLTRAAARELASSGITCNAIAPGFIESAMTAGTNPDKLEKQKALVPLGRFGLPAEVAALTAFLASDEAAYITGQVLAVDGGLRI